MLTTASRRCASAWDGRRRSNCRFVSLPLPESVEGLSAVARRKVGRSLLSLSFCTLCRFSIEARRAFDLIELRGVHDVLVTWRQNGLHFLLRVLPRDLAS